MVAFLRCFRALLWRNAIYRKRQWISSLFEYALPLCTIGILVFLKKTGGDKPGTIQSDEAPIFPGNSEAIIPLSFTDYVTALQAKRKCEFNPMNAKYLTLFGVTGIQGDWSVPFVHCDSRKCESLGQNATAFCEHRVLGLAPRNEETENFKAWIYSKHGALRNRQNELPFNFDFVQIFTTEKDLESYIESSSYGNISNPKIGGAIIITSGSPSYNYTIRVNSTNFNKPEEASRPAARTTPSTSRVLETYAKSPDDVCVPAPITSYLGKWNNYCTGQYIYNGAITLQRLVDDWIIFDSGAEDFNLTGNKVAENGVRFASFPRWHSVNDGFASIAEFVPLLITLGLIYPVSNSIRVIVLEKELRQRELMQIMSVPISAIEWSWFVSLCLFYLPASILISITSTQLFSNSSLSMLLLFWIFVFLSSITFVLVIAAFTSKSSRATLVGVMIYFIGYFISIFIDHTSFNPAITSLLSLHPAVAIGYGLQTIGMLEDSGVGIVKGTFSFSDNPSGYSFASCIGSLIIDVIVWGVFSLYLNRVVQGDYGRPNPLYFPFTKSFWFPNSIDSSILEGSENAEVREGTIIEPVSDALKEQRNEGKSIELLNLTKRFGQKTAVDRLTLSLYSGQVTALLGHNGAGKTTTINMLTGMISATEGCALIGGKDISSQMPIIREEIGICLQHDCLFPLLTVKEHVQFFFQIKGGYSKRARLDADACVETSIQDVALLEKKNTFAKNLSGGMKRKLSVAIAFCGDSKFVFLDEPTSGMDPFSRRFIWNIIRRYRSNRCIVLTTHFMDEADLLGDRIAIMSEGCLHCAASPLFLKRAYGVGYQLTIEKNGSTAKNISSIKLSKNNHETNLHTNEAIDVPVDTVLSKSVLENVTERNVSNNVGTELQINEEKDMPMDAILSRIVLKNVTDGNVLSNVGTEMIFQLPLHSSNKFINMFAELDRLVDDKKIVTYGIGITTLDEVFLMVARRGMANVSTYNETSYPSIESSIQSDHNFEMKTSQNNDITTKQEIRYDTSSNELFRRHVGALFSKRAKNFRRDKRAWFCSTLLPSLVTLVGFIAMKKFAQTKDMTPLVLTLEDYNKEIKMKRNPVVYNNGHSFDCNPGVCIMPKVEFNIEETGEYYTYCGAAVELTRVLEENKCSVNSTTSYANEIIDSGATLVEDTKSSSILEISNRLFEISTAPMFEASMYGALYFNRDMSSTIGNSSLHYNDVSYEACLIAGSNYRSLEQCKNFMGISYVVVTNFTAPHAPLLFQAIADEAIINDAIEEKISILASIHPLPTTSLEKSFTVAENSMLAWFVLIFSFPFITGSFATFIVAERASKAKHMQTVAGVKPAAYWISSYLWDILNYQLPLWIIISLIYLIGIDVFSTSERGAAAGTIISLLLFGPAAAGFTYCITFLFDSPSTCNFIVICANFFFGLAGPLISYILRIIAVRDFNPVLSNAAVIMEWCLRLIPSFCLGRSLFFAINVDVFELIQGHRLSVWSPVIMRFDMIFLALESVLYISLAILLDGISTDPMIIKKWNKVADIFNIRKGKNKSATIDFDDMKDHPNTLKDDDVVAEENRVLSAHACTDDPIVLKKLTKMYGNGKLAVNQLSLGIPPGECFGLLGINGAGKTTTMNILTTEFPPTYGDAILANHSITSSPSEIRQCIGYCPQFDAHFMNMTGREHVELYASIKGVSKDSIKQVASYKLKEVGINEYDADRLSSVYSGGMKRKLSVACATIGQPKIVFLDEPSTGMDPVARRDLWKVISKMVSQVDSDGNPSTSMILTTHSMEECEALCPRIGIMAGGKLRCLGSAQRLKSRFGKGFQIELKVEEVEPNDEDYKIIIQNLAKIVDDILLSSRNHSDVALGEFSAVTLDVVKKSVETLTNDESLSSLISSDDPTGYLIYKNARSEAGVTISELGLFCASEIRVQNLIDFVTDSYPDAKVRERQDNKVRFEVTSEGLKISSLFTLVENNKANLRLTDYGISQTTLEQVFNVHAAEAEEVKKTQKR